MIIKDRFIYPKHGVIINHAMRVEEGYRLSKGHFDFMDFLRGRMDKSLFGRELSFPLSDDTLRLLMLDASLKKCGREKGFMIYEQKVVDGKILIKGTRTWEAEHGFKPLLMRLTFVNSRSGV